MFEGFDDFAEQNSQELQGREIVARETKPEWEMLKGLTESLALDGKGIELDKFEWISDEYTPRLVLDKVAVTFQARVRNGNPIECRLRFDRKPLGPGQYWSDEDFPLSAVVWSLKPVAMGEHVYWSVDELGDTPISSSELADQVAVELAKFHLAYKKHYEGWFPGKTG
jgi:hypothetical protein